MVTDPTGTTGPAEALDALNAALDAAEQRRAGRRDIVLRLTTPNPQQGTLYGVTGHYLGEVDGGLHVYGYTTRQARRIRRRLVQALLDEATRRA